MLIFLLVDDAIIISTQADPVRYPLGYLYSHDSLLCLLRCKIAETLLRP